MQWKWADSTPYHSICFAIYPLVHLLARNSEHVTLGLVLQLSAFFFGITSLLWLVFRTIAHMRPQAAAIATSAALLCLFSYYPLVLALSDWDLVPVQTRLYMYLWPLPVIVLCAIVVWLKRTRHELSVLTTFLNLAAIVLVCLSVSDLLLRVVEAARVEGCVSCTGSKTDPRLVDSRRRIAPRDHEMLPDIYYIVLDAYARSDVLKEVYQYDNSRFLKQLADRGFFIADGSFSNYAQTFLSLSSTLNFCYLEARQPCGERGRLCMNQVIAKIDQCELLRILKRLDYRFIAFPSGIVGTEFRGADQYVSPLVAPTFLQYYVMRMTTLSPLVDALFPALINYSHRNLVLHNFEKLASIKREGPPIFAFCHIMSPHPPFVFNERGEPVDQRDSEITFSDGSHFHYMEKARQEHYVEGYRRQIPFTEKKTIEMVDSITSNSDRPLVIILQADHGPGSLLDWYNTSNVHFRERMGILNAYYVPERCRRFLHSNISPVNTFRILLRCCLGIDMDLLPDKSYFSSWQHPLQFIDVTEKVRLQRSTGAP
ncbi:MAG: sulfatase-like hydrolase/transferase [Thermodesulfobacteriota bacterium]